MIGSTKTDYHGDTEKKKLKTDLRDLRAFVVNRV